jgi:uncharacterized membrane protein YjgN (DUF898 family)
MLDEIKPLYTGNERESLRFEFTGKGGEYFAIWIVNLLLTIITLGIYSPWAKVRREQYFHRSTLLDGHPFDYTGQPVKILIGRVLALVVIVGGSVLQKIDFKIALAVTAFFALIYPWVIVRSAKFRARNTRYRNIAFRFSGTTWQAVKAYGLLYLVLLPLVAFSLYLAAYQQTHGGVEAMPPNFMQMYGGAFIGTLILFIAVWPLYLARMKAFVHRNLHYGSTQGEFDGSAGEFFKALLRVSGLSLLAFLIMAVMIFGGAMIGTAIGGLAGKITMGIIVLAGYSALVLPQAAYFSYITNTTIAHATLGNLKFESDLQAGRYAKLLLTNLLLLIFTAGFAWPWTRVRLMRYRIENTGVLATPAALDQVVAQASRDESAIGEEAAEFLDFDLSL